MPLHISKTQKTAYSGLLLACCLILSYIENLIPFNFGIPGIKIGLSNLPVVVCLYLFGPIFAFGLTVLKALISSMLFGTAFSFFYALAGAVLSVICMILLYKTKLFHALSVSAAGGMMHNVGQIAIAYFVIQSDGLLYYLPYLLLSGLIFGLLLGIIASLLIKPLKMYLLKETN